MNRPISSPQPCWTDVQLADAVRASTNWRRVLLQLGFGERSRSAGAVLFFIVDGDMTMYLIPSRAIAGRVRILLRTYQKYIVGNASGLLGAAAEGSKAVLPRVPRRD